MSFPRPDVARNAVLGPLVAAAHPSGVGCIATTPGVTLTHIRADTPEGPVDRLEVHAAAEPDATLLTGPAMWAGPYFAHFGHMLAESLHRLWAAVHFPELKDARIVFQAMPGAVRRPWFDAMLELVGIGAGRVVLVDWGKWV